MIFPEEIRVRYIKIIFTCAVLVLLLFMLNACKSKDGQNEKSANGTPVEAGAYPTILAESITLEPSTEELIDPSFAGGNTGVENQEVDAYPAVSSGEDFTYPGIVDEGLYPYPASDTEGSSTYPEPVNDPTETSQTLPAQDQTTPTPTPTPTQANLTTIEPTSTVTPAVVATLTPSPSPTPSPTASPTATSLPLFVDRSLKASDPKTLKLASGKVQLIEFFAFWDATSKALAPILNQLRTEFGHKANFFFLDIDDPATQNIKKQLGYQLQPHLFLVDAKGNIIEDWTGFIDEAEVRDEISKALQR